MSNANVFFREQLYQMRQNYKNKPLDDIKLSRPNWLDDKDPMSEIYSKKSELLQQGEIVYASIVQANMILFNRFPPYNCPAQILYSAEPYFSENSEVLLNTAQKIYKYKGKELDTVPDEWKEVTRVITDEYDRTDFTFTLNLDNQSLKYNMITTMVYRKLLPKGKLCGNILPVLTIPNCKQVLILPKQYWTKEFTKLWVKGFI
ncbi:MAG: hypothetical protein UH241_07535 [Acutalibacteraceae bacterium]|nr:hypothetical protein [Acutalibacteraceae bacterium]